jgi:hypothetical protein
MPDEPLREATIVVLLLRQILELTLHEIARRWLTLSRMDGGAVVICA